MSWGDPHTWAIPMGPQVGPENRISATAWPATPEESGCGCGDYTCHRCCPGELADELRERRARAGS